MEKTIYKAFNSATRKMVTIELNETELLPGQKVVKMFWCASGNTYVTIPGASLFVVDSNYNLVACEN